LQKAGAEKGKKADVRPGQDAGNLGLDAESAEGQKEAGYDGLVRQRSRFFADSLNADRHLEQPGNKRFGQILIQGKEREDSSRNFRRPAADMGDGQKPVDYGKKDDETADHQQGLHRLNDRIPQEPAEGPSVLDPFLMKEPERIFGGEGAALFFPLFPRPVVPHDQADGNIRSVMGGGEQHAQAGIVKKNRRQPPRK